MLTLSEFISYFEDSALADNIRESSLTVSGTVSSPSGSG